MALLRLPNELLERFEVPPLLCRTTQDAATACFYRSITIASSHQAKGLLNTLNDRSELASLIQSLEIDCCRPVQCTWGERNPGSSELSGQACDHVELTAALIPRCVALRHLELRQRLSSTRPPLVIKVARSLVSLDLSVTSRPACEIPIILDCEHLAALSIAGFASPGLVPVRARAVKKLTISGSWWPGDVTAGFIRSVAGNGLQQLRLCSYKARTDIEQALAATPDLKRLTLRCSEPLSALAIFTRPCGVHLDVLSFSRNDIAALRDIKVREEWIGSEALGSLVASIAKAGTIARIILSFMATPAASSTPSNFISPPPAYAAAPTSRATSVRGVSSPASSTRVAPPSLRPPQRSQSPDVTSRILAFDLTITADHVISQRSQSVPDSRAAAMEHAPIASRPASQYDPPHFVGGFVDPHDRRSDVLALFTSDPRFRADEIWAPAADQQRPPARDDEDDERRLRAAEQLRPARGAARPRLSPEHPQPTAIAPIWDPRADAGDLAPFQTSPRALPEHDPAHANAQDPLLNMPQPQRALDEEDERRFRAAEALRATRAAGLLARKSAQDRASAVQTREADRLERARSQRLNIAQRLAERQAALAHDRQRIAEAQLRRQSAMDHALERERFIADDVERKRLAADAAGLMSSDPTAQAALYSAIANREAAQMEMAQAQAEMAALERRAQLEQLEYARAEEMAMRREQQAYEIQRRAMAYEQIALQNGLALDRQLAMEELAMDDALLSSELAYGPGSMAGMYNDDLYGYGMY